MKKGNTAMNDLEKYKSNNIVILNETMEVDCIQWGYSHLNCDAIFVDSSDHSIIKIVAYALNEDGNKELRSILKENPKLKLLVGLDESMTNLL